MSRRAPLALILALSTATTAVACGSSDSTPASTPSSTVATVDLRSDSFTLTADRREGLTVLSEESDSISVEIPDDAFPSGVDSADITATVNRLTATDVGSAVEFELGPDGTEFDEPVTLTWTAEWDTEASVGVSAIAEDGSNLLSADDTEEVLKTLQVVPNDDGTSTISVDIDHFSVWTFFTFPGAGSAISAEKSGGGYFLLGSYEDDGTVVVAADVLPGVTSFMAVKNTELCLEVSNLTFSGVESAKANQVAANGFRECTTAETFVDLALPTSCDGTGQGFIQGTSTAYFGLAGLSPFALLLVLAGGETLTQSDQFRQSDSWANASGALLFIRRSFRQNIPCAPPTTISTAMSTTTMTDSDTSLAQPTTTLRSGSSGATNRTTTVAPTTTATSTTTTTTTIKATTTTKPRQGATTTLPRPTPGGTTTLP